MPKVVPLLLRYASLIALAGGVLGASWRGASWAYDHTVGQAETKTAHQESIQALRQEFGQANDGVRRDVYLAIDSLRAEVRDLQGVSLDVLCSPRMNPNHWRCKSARR